MAGGQQASLSQGTAAPATAIALRSRKTALPSTIVLTGQTLAANQGTLRAVITDALAGQALTLSRGSMSASSSSGGGALGLEQDWIDRSTASGVTQAIRFDLAANVTNYRHIDGQEANIVQNATGGILGDGCLRINVPASSGSNPGAWRAPLNSAWTTDTEGFGSADYYTQFRVKFGPNRWTTDPGASGGAKIANWSQYKQSSPNSSQSHLNSEVVAQFLSQTEAVLIGYNDTASAGGQSSNIFDLVDYPQSGDINFQNSVDNGSGVADKFARYCLYQPGQPSNISAGCVRFVENVWYTIYVHQKVVTPNGTTGNIFEMWYAGPTDTSYRPLVSLTNQLFGYDAEAPNGNNGIWLLPYKTGRTSGSETWHEYDQLIVSTSPIACPQPLPAWFGSTLNTWFNAGAGSRLSLAQTYTEPSGVSHTGMLAYSGGTQMGTSAYTGMCPGHLDGASNAMFKIDMAADSPAWELLITSSTSVQQNVTHYADGRPSAAHTGWQIQAVPERNRIFRFGSYSVYGNGGTVTNKVDAFNLSNNTYDPADTWATVSNINNGGASNPCCKDSSGNVYVLRTLDGNLLKWTQSSATWTDLGFSRAGVIYNTPMAYDPVRNRIVYAHGSSSWHYNLATSTFTNISMSADGGASFFWCGDLGVFLYKAHGSSTVEQIDPVTFTKTTYSVSGTPPAEASDAVNYLHGRMDWNEALGIVFCYTQTTTNLHAFRTR